MIPKSTSMLEAMFESKFWTLWDTRSVLEEWDAWLDGNGILKIKWSDAGLDYFKSQESDTVCIKNPTSRLFAGHYKLLLVPKELAIKMLTFGEAP